MSHLFETTIQEYVKIEKVGEGTYGVVFKGRHKKRGEIVAMKKVKYQYHDDGIPSSTVREISLLRDLRHQNIVELKDVLLEDNEIFLIFEFVDMDLSRFLKLHPTGINKPRVRHFILQILHGIQYCHERRIMHRDLKPQNVLMTDSGQIKIADFGSSRAFGVPVRILRGNVVTLWYRAPEILLGSTNYGCPIDLWSIGIIMTEIIMGEVMFRADTEAEQLNVIFSVLGAPTNQSWPAAYNLPYFEETSTTSFENTFTQRLCPGLSEAAVDLLHNLLILNPDERMTANEALRHDYFSS